MSVDFFEVVSTLVVALGVGSIVSAYILVKSQNKKWMFETKLVKYSNLIQAYQEYIAKQDENTRQSYVSCQKQVELVGEEEIINLTEQLYDNITNNNTELLTRENLVK